MDLLYRVSEIETGHVIHSLRAWGFDAELSDVVVGRGRGAVLVRGVANAEEAEEADLAVLVVDATFTRIGQL